jgi:hypothetical protein
MTDGSNSRGPAKVSRAEAKAERRQQLIDATIEAIARFGLSGMTMGKVTEIAGVSVGLANFHFESKENLPSGSPFTAMPVRAKSIGRPSATWTTNGLRQAWPSLRK